MESKYAERLRLLVEGDACAAGQITVELRPVSFRHKIRLRFTKRGGLTPIKKAARAGQYSSKIRSSDGTLMKFTEGNLAVIDWVSQSNSSTPKKDNCGRSRIAGIPDDQ